MKYEYLLRIEQDALEIEDTLKIKDSNLSIEDLATKLANNQEAYDMFKVLVHKIKDPTFYTW